MPHRVRPAVGPRPHPPPFGRSPLPVPGRDKQRFTRPSHDPSCPTGPPLPGTGSGYRAEAKRRHGGWGCGPEAEGWTPLERAILQAVDELHRDAFISDATWKALAAHYDEKQLIDLVFTVGQYTMVSMALNTLGVQIEDQS